jgi:hypothetical protein
MEARDWLLGGRQSWIPRLLVENMGKSTIIRFLLHLHFDGHLLLFTSDVAGSKKGSKIRQLEMDFTLRRPLRTDSHCAVTRCHVAKFSQVDPLDLLGAAQCQKEKGEL